VIARSAVTLIGVRVAKASPKSRLTPSASASIRGAEEEGRHTERERPKTRSAILCEERSEIFLRPEHGRILFY
jgi:hypothetical protein